MLEELLDRGFLINWFERLFSSTAFALCARGLQELIANEGTMSLIITPILSKKDAQALRESTSESIISNSIKIQLDNIQSGFEKDHVLALKYLLHYLD